MRKQNDAGLSSADFKPLDESQLSDEWVLSDYVMDKLKCSPNTYKGYIKNKLLPVSKLGARRYHNTADLQHLMITLRRLSLMLLPPALLIIEWAEMLCL